MTLELQVRADGKSNLNRSWPINRITQSFYPGIIVVALAVPASSNAAGIPMLKKSGISREAVDH